MIRDFGQPVNAPPAQSRRRRVIGLAAFPSMMTLGNGICGLAALVMLAKAYTFLQLGEGHLNQASDAMFDAAVFVAFGGLLDVIDGRLARMTGTEGAFGRELDSLCDAITFGLTPAFFMRVFGEAIFGSGIEDPPTPLVRLMWVVSALYLACTLIRLARFNIESEEEDDDHMNFRGLPSPAAAATCLALFLVSWYHRDHETGKLAFMPEMTVLIPCAGITIAILMVSRVRYMHVFNRLLSGRRSIMYFVLLLVLAGGIYTLDRGWELAVAGLILMYAASGPARLIWSIARNWTRFGRRLRVSQRRRATAREAATKGGR